jgi:DNA-binding NtrC family response regulator
VADQILFVDDDENVLDGYERMLHEQFQVSKARGGAHGLATIQVFGPFAVVISNMRMPGMNGAEFLALVRQMAPNTVRMILTGHKDINLARQAVSEGRIFRYLTKPCGKAALTYAIKMAIAEYHAVSAEKEVLRRAEEMQLGVLIES